MNTKPINGPPEKIADKVRQDLRQPLADLRSQLIGIKNIDGNGKRMFLPEYTTQISKDYNFYS